MSVLVPMPRFLKAVGNDMGGHTFALCGERGQP